MFANVNAFAQPIMAKRQMEAQNALTKMGAPQPQSNAYNALATSSATVAAQNAMNGLATVDFELDGKARPNKPDAALLNVLSQAAASSLGEGARVVVYSGKEDEGHQHGSNRHKTGLAADIRVYDGSGKLVTLNDPRALAFALAAAQGGVRGIGAGSEYMGDAFHMDMVPHSQYSANQGPIWGTWAKQNGKDILAAMGL